MEARTIARSGPQCVHCRLLLRKSTSFRGTKGDNLYHNPASRRSAIPQYGPNDFAGHVGQPVEPTLELVREPAMVDAGQVQDRGVQIMDGDGVLRDVVAVVVGRAVGHARANAAAG